MSEQRILPSATNAQATFELPSEYIKRGWMLEIDSFNWCVAANPVTGQKTQAHFLAAHRGLKYIIRGIKRLEAAA